MFVLTEVFNKSTFNLSQRLPCCHVFHVLW